MYIPDKWKIKSVQALHGFIEQHSFASVITENLEASHLPLLLDSTQGKFGCLHGHFAKANVHWQLADKAKVLAIFSGPHAYISPTWYETQPAVPTWNYTAVHVRGTACLCDSKSTNSILDDLIAKYEPGLSIAEEFRAKLLTGIVGFKINIESIEGKEKLGQHRSNQDQLAVSSKLKEHKNFEEKLLYQYMLKRQLGTGE